MNVISRRTFQRLLSCEYKKSQVDDYLYIYCSRTAEKRKGTAHAVLLTVVTFVPEIRGQWRYNGLTPRILFARLCPIPALVPRPKFATPSWDPRSAGFAKIAYITSDQRNYVLKVRDWKVNRTWTDFTFSLMASNDKLKQKVEKRHIVRTCLPRIKSCFMLLMSLTEPQTLNTPSICKPTTKDTAVDQMKVCCVPYSSLKTVDCKM